MKGWDFSSTEVGEAIRGHRMLNHSHGVGKLPELVIQHAMPANCLTDLR